MGKPKHKIVTPAQYKTGWIRPFQSNSPMTLIKKLSDKEYLVEVPKEEG